MYRNASHQYIEILSSLSQKDNLYAVITDNPFMLRRLWKKHREKVKLYMAIIEIDKPQRIAPLGQKYNIKIRKLASLPG